MLLILEDRIRQVPLIASISYQGRPMHLRLTLINPVAKDESMTDPSYISDAQNWL